jgi:hypothetical protein
VRPQHHVALDVESSWSFDQGLDQGLPDAMDRRPEGRERI